MKNKFLLSLVLFLGVLFICSEIGFAQAEEGWFRRTWKRWSGQEKQETKAVETKAAAVKAPAKVLPQEAAKPKAMPAAAAAPAPAKVETVGGGYETKQTTKDGGVVKTKYRTTAAPISREEALKDVKGMLESEGDLENDVSGLEKKMDKNNMPYYTYKGKSLEELDENTVLELDDLITAAVNQRGIEQTQEELQRMRELRALQSIPKSTGVPVTSAPNTQIPEIPKPPVTPTTSPQMTTKPVNPNVQLPTAPQQAPKIPNTSAPVTAPVTQATTPSAPTATGK